MDTIGMFVILALIGAVSGFVNVLAGGGSLLSMPAMRLLLDMGGPEVNGTNRIAIGAGAISAVTGFFKKGFSDLKLSLTLALCALPGAAAGAYYGTKLEGVWFNRVLAGVMIGVLLLMSFKRPASRQPTSSVIATKTRWIVGHALMLVAGFYGGFIQAGVGFILMAILHKVMGLDLVRVNMHKVFIVAAYTIVALAIYAGRGHVLWFPGVCLAIGNASGAWIGTHITVQKGEPWIRWVFNMAVAALVIKLLTN